MKAYKAKVKLKALRSIIDIPEDIVSPEVEMIILSDSSGRKKIHEKKTVKNVRGALKQYANPELISKEDEFAWKSIVEEKHGIL